MNTCNLWGLNCIQFSFYFVNWDMRIKITASHSDSKISYPTADCFSGLGKNAKKQGIFIWFSVDAKKFQKNKL